MDQTDNYRLNKCQHCDGTGFVRVVDRDRYKNTEKMSPSELAVIVRDAVRSPVPPAPVSFPSIEPPTLPDEGWTYRHLLSMQAKQWRWIQLGLSLALAVLAYVLGRQR